MDHPARYNGTPQRAFPTSQSPLRSTAAKSSQRSVGKGVLHASRQLRAPSSALGTVRRADAEGGPGDQEANGVDGDDQQPDAVERLRSVIETERFASPARQPVGDDAANPRPVQHLYLIHISEPTRQRRIT